MAVIGTNGIGRVTLGRAIGEGGEGTVHTVIGRPDICFKDILPDPDHPDATGLNEEQARLLQCHLRNVPGVARIRGLGHDERGRFVGYFLDRGGDEQLIAVCDKPLSNAQRVALALQVVETIAALNERGFLHGDPHPRNWVDRNGRPLLVDLCAMCWVDVQDAYGVPTTRQVRRFAEGVLAPELIEGPCIQTAYSQGFSACVLAHLALKAGQHPCHCRTPTGESQDPQDLILNGWFGRFSASELPTDWEPLDLGIPYAQIHPAVMDCWRRTFATFLRQPEKRATAAELAAALRQMGKSWRHWPHRRKAVLALAFAAAAAGAVAAARSPRTPDRQPATRAELWRTLGDGAAIEGGRR